MSIPLPMKTVLITGCSSGIGRATAKLFQRNGWRVVATLRHPDQETELKKLDDVILLPLDVNDATSVGNAVNQALKKCGQIDVLINNAGYALMGAFENASEEQIRRQFDTNVFGLMRVTRALLPHFRQRKAGLIINVASMAGRLPIPLMSVYNGSKWAVQGFSECLTYELAPFNIQVKIVEPGAVDTAFFGRSGDRDNSTGVNAYDALMAEQFPVLDKTGPGGSTCEEAAAVIFRAATDGKSTLRYSVGKDARILLSARKVLPDQIFLPMIRWSLTPQVFSRFGRLFYKT